MFVKATGCHNVMHKEAWTGRQETILQLRNASEMREVSISTCKVDSVLEKYADLAPTSRDAAKQDAVEAK